MEIIEPVGKLVSRWGEGPIWWEDSLYYVDIEGHQVCRYTPFTEEERIWSVGERVGFVVPRKGGGLVIGGDSGLHFFDLETGEKSLISDPEPNQMNHRFNDGKCSPDGRLFAGTISLMKNPDANLYRLDPDLHVAKAYGPVTNSNGLVWSLDGRILYYIDTPRREIMAFDYDSQTGILSAQRVVVDTKHIDASPDGMTIDVAGRLWVAFCHGACVGCFDPSTGKEIERVSLPCLESTAVAFGGSDLVDLYVTTGIHKTQVEELAGRLLVIKNLGTQGVKASSFTG